VSSFLRIWTICACAAARYRPRCPFSRSARSPETCLKISLLLRHGRSRLPQFIELLFRHRDRVSGAGNGHRGLARLRPIRQITDRIPETASMREPGAHRESVSFPRLPIGPDPERFAGLQTLRLHQKFGGFKKWRGVDLLQQRRGLIVSPHRHLRPRDLKLIQPNGEGKILVISPTMSISVLERLRKLIQ